MILEAEIRIIEAALEGKRGGNCSKEHFQFPSPFQVTRAPRARIRSRVPLSQYPRSVDIAPYVGC